MSRNPLDVVAGRRKEIRKALAAIEKIRLALERERERLAELEAAVGPAASRDRVALGKALVDGRPEPASEADALRLEVEQQKRRVDALVVALDAARARVPEIVREHRANWHREQAREVARAHERYLAAIAELEAARDAYSDEVGALAWITNPDGGVADAVTDALAGRPGIVRGGPVLAMSRVLEELRADAETISEWLVTRDEPPAEPRFELIRRAS